MRNGWSGTRESRERREGSPYRAKLKSGEALRRALFLSCLIAALALGDAPARAGAWLPAPKTGQIISHFTYSAANDRFNAQGQSVPHGRFRKETLNIYYEVGWKPSIALIGSVLMDFQDDHIERRVFEEEDAFLAGTGLRLRLYRGDQWAAALEFAMGYAQTRRRPARLTDRGFTTDTALIVGRGFQICALPAFWELQTRFASDGRDRHSDYASIISSFGMRPWDRLEIITQLLSQWETDAEQPASFVKTQISAIYGITDGVALQAGGVFTLSGQNIEREEGAFLGVILRY